MKNWIMKLFRIMLIFLGIVFFPFGLFLLGYIIGRRARKSDFVVSKKEPSKIVETEILTEEKVVL